MQVQGPAGVQGRWAAEATSRTAPSTRVSTWRIKEGATARTSTSRPRPRRPSSRRTRPWWWWTQKKEEEEAMAWVWTSSCWCSSRTRTIRPLLGRRLSQTRIKIPKSCTLARTARKWSERSKTITTYITLLNHNARKLIALTNRKVERRSASTHLYKLFVSSFIIFQDYILF